jgi:SAM-dependent methyltransferase
MEVEASEQREIIAACPVCGAAEAAAYAVHPQVRWVKCDCGLIYKKFSGEVASAPTTDAFADHAGVYHRRRRRRIAKSRAQIREVLNHVRPGRLLDIGCSLGHTLRAAQQLALPAEGVEIHPESVAWCRAEGLEVAPGTMDHLPCSTGSIQIVMMKHVLEHTPDPRAALAEVWRVLANGGGLFIAVPHGGYNKAVRDPTHSRFYVPTVLEGSHFIFYTPATLERLLRAVGFDVVRVGPHLVHRSASLPTRALQIAVAPLRWIVERTRDAFALRKEFWMVAVKPANAPRYSASPRRSP